ncbi:hypothetical protein CONPUDRAFT_79946 [Coniophora puteana RWD-64-598 SS2]|uniref:Xylanolytic transcriptional activator regulatory domain-containing protein n=1 Tax=Coniophora puteana (strain RWD-64-598) TaxID=741705 RepID=A0A5M3N1Z4_CONPW|nr:uncharacterized protein CONPUDRAFT_79946 [Coniophora puteana RWD-64-598 SS2]EIW85297.1 hypothetical protein CONPUDRAFT_79946 [Coniophora puteana RWD-64-598 SS2]
MKCVGADESGQTPCERCRRTNSNCIFEKHRRGRKPGSKLSEASKMLRRLEKNLNSAKLKSQSNEKFMASSGISDGHNPSTNIPVEGRLRGVDQTSDRYTSSGMSSQTMDVDEDDNDTERGDDQFPAKMIKKKENQFFKIILNPEHKSPSLSPTSRATIQTPVSQTRSASGSKHPDPIDAGLVSEEKAEILFDSIFLRLNPFINLFDPSLHTVSYVRSKSPFLFTTLIMAGCKFFEPSAYKDCLDMAQQYAVRAFSEAWKSVEVVQAFACLTYWREQNDNRTWMYIGYACRMAVELGLNKLVTKPPPNETALQMRQRRNYERTYLVLFVHDRSLSMQTGRHWMLPEDELIRHSDTWHEEGGPVKCEDVVVAAMVQLRRIAGETTDMFRTNRTSADDSNYPSNVGIVLNGCNTKLDQWKSTWQTELRRANGQSFHYSFLLLFWSYIRLFLNSFGLQHRLPPANRSSTHLMSLHMCYVDALEILRIASKDFREFGVLVCFTLLQQYSIAHTLVSATARSLLPS